MSDVEALRRAYREIQAPPWLATRVRARLDDHPVRPSRLLPAGAAAVVILGAVLLSWQLVDRQAPPRTSPAASFAVLAEMAPERPSAPVPGLSSIQSVPIPTLPARPTTAGRSEPPLLNQVTRKENNHA